MNFFPYNFTPVPFNHLYVVLPQPWATLIGIREGDEALIEGEGYVRQVPAMEDHFKVLAPLRKHTDSPFAPNTSSVECAHSFSFNSCLGCATFALSYAPAPCYPRLSLAGFSCLFRFYLQYRLYFLIFMYNPIIDHHLCKWYVFKYALPDPDVRNE